MTEPAIPHLKRPRKWRLTMYPADGKPATKDFMKACTAAPQNSFHGELHADDASATVNPMRITNSPSAAAEPVYQRKPQHQLGFASQTTPFKSSAHTSR